jgi:hypothetical protein
VPVVELERWVVENAEPPAVEAIGTRSQAAGGPSGRAPVPTAAAARRA